MSDGILKKILLLLKSQINSQYYNNQYDFLLGILLCNVHALKLILTIGTVSIRYLILCYIIMCVRLVVIRDGFHSF